MAVRTSYPEPPSPKGNPIFFPESALAHQWCKGEGLEIGAAAHNPFGLPGSTHVAPGDDLDHFRQHEINMCGMYAEIDIEAEAHNIPLPNGSQDYIISSHVVEHFPDPIRAFLEWKRLLKPGGIVFMILPQPDALKEEWRPVVEIEELEKAYQEGYTVDNFPDPRVVRRSHYYVYNLSRMIEFIAYLNEHYGLDWDVVATEDPDQKVGNGFTVVCQHNPKSVEKAPELTIAESVDEES